MQAISELFDQTTLILPLRTTLPPSGASLLTGHNLHIHSLPEPSSHDLRRKLALLTWLPRHLPRIWNEVKQADAVHAPVPGDIGVIGILVALLQRKPLFVRHCGTWAEPVTLADHLLLWLLERIAGGRNVVLATGGGDTPPSQKNPNIHWIFSTALTEQELASIPPAQPWRPGQPLRLVTVGRLTAEKNVASVIRALPILRNSSLPGGEGLGVRDISLHILGDGEARASLEALAAELGIVDQVTFHGNVPHDEVLGILSQSHLFVFPTRVKEGFPKAVLEALAVGLPVIATNVSVIPHLIKDSGCVLPDTTPKAVAQAILSLIENPENVREMAQNARVTAQQYTLERWRDEIGAHLEAAWGPLRANTPA
ncbi:MAG: glycosyltransferase family 4 protein [Chloroflexota bacterium]